ncbi:unnamed protein product [Paramecium primaurelia]|uniref:Uncharacterized protein n=2 Tax=Paramecium TaxID=5884 RepID=A0A8S1TME4_9CILI|nr:unnamed protein product [Paramecium primaurelia]CAD8153143.1 unnamed protein product [Paramecium pentaurelia]
MGSKAENQIEQYSGQDFGDKISFTVGVSYMLASSIGLLKGAIEGFPRQFNMPKKLILNNFFNAVGKRTSTYGQAAASASMLYYFVGAGMNLLFEDELADINQLKKNMLCGAISGAIYKSTLGIVPFFVGGIVGGSLIGGVTLLVENFNRRGIVAFEMKF